MLGREGFPLVLHNQTSKENSLLNTTGFLQSCGWPGWAGQRFFLIFCLKEKLHLEGLEAISALSLQSANQDSL